MLINKGDLRKLLSYAYIQLPFTEIEKDSMARKIPLPAVINDLTVYKKINIDGYALPSNTDCKVTGWRISNKGILTDYYGTETNIEASVIVFLDNREKVVRAVSDGRRSLVSSFNKMGTGHVRTEWNVQEGSTKNLS